MSIDPAYLALIQSDRVSERTRAALLARAEPDNPGYAPLALTVAQLAVLRCVTARILPQPIAGAIDLAARIDAALASGPGDGWRFNDLPADTAATRAGLDLLEHAAAGSGGFAALNGPAQDALLQQLGDGALAGALDATQQRHWFEDIRAEAVRHYVAHPQTLAGMGYSGIGYGGDTPRLPGFVALEPGEREPWEPLTETGSTP